jgi:hypothetical protein
MTLQNFKMNDSGEILFSEFKKNLMTNLLEIDSHKLEVLEEL